MTDDVVAELDAWLNGQRGFSINLVIQRARDEIVALREMRDAHVRMLSAEFDERDEALEEAAVTCLRKARDHVIPIGQDNYHDGCVSCASAIRVLKEKA